jgi:serine/threonine-protein kinase RsbW
MKSKKNKILNDNSISAVSDFSELHRIRAFVINRAAAFGFDETESNKIALAVDEACTNLIEHSYKFDKGKVLNVKVEPDVRKFIVRISDNGSPFNPLEVQDIDVKDYIHNYKRGGLGIHIIRAIMDEIAYYPSSESSQENVLLLTKMLRKS